MQQSIEKAGAKAEAILKKMVESGKLHPGSLGKVSTLAPNHDKAAILSLGPFDTYMGVWPPHFRASLFRRHCMECSSM